MSSDIVDLSRPHRATVRLLATLGLASFSFMLLFVLSGAWGRIDQVHELVPAGSPEAQLGADHPGETVHIAGATAGVVVGAAGLIGLIIHPQRAGSATHAGAAAIAMMLTTGVVGDPDNHGGQGLLIDPAFLLLALPPLAAAAAAHPWHAWRQGGIRRPHLLVLAALGLPWVWYGIDQGLMQRNTWPPMADSHHQAHWYAMSVLAFLVVLVIAAASLHGRGWRPAATTAGTAAIALAIAALVEPSSASALSPVWASLAAAWGTAILVVTWRATQHIDQSGHPFDGTASEPEAPGTTAT